MKNTVTPSETPLIRISEASQEGATVEPSSSKAGSKPVEVVTVKDSLILADRLSIKDVNFN